MENLKFENAALVLEGGGLRGTFTSGALRRFTEDKLYFSYVIGVSMGACNAANYVSLQTERNRIVNTRYVRDSRYISYRRLLMGGDLFGMNFIFETIPNKLIPFDYKTFYESPVRCMTGVTDCISGEVHYFDKHDLGDDYIEILKASCSLPFVSKPVKYKGNIYMDGGMADPIPIHRAVDDGWKKRVVILTRQRGYQKRPPKLPGFMLWRYRNFPGLKKCILMQYKRYNETIDFIEELEKKGDVFVIRPDREPPAGRVERNISKIYLAYDQGYAEASLRFPELLVYLQS